MGPTKKTGKKKRSAAVLATRLIGRSDPTSPRRHSLTRTVFLYRVRPSRGDPPLLAHSCSSTTCCSRSRPSRRRSCRSCGVKAPLSGNGSKQLRTQRRRFRHAPRGRRRAPSVPVKLLLSHETIPTRNGVGCLQQAVRRPPRPRRPPCLLRNGPRLLVPVAGRRTQSFETRASRRIQASTWPPRRSTMSSTLGKSAHSIDTGEEVHDFVWDENTHLLPVHTTHAPLSPRHLPRWPASSCCKIFATSSASSTDSEAIHSSIVCRYQIPQ